MHNIYSRKRVRTSEKYSSWKMMTEGGDMIMYNLVHYEDDSYPLLLVLPRSRDTQRTY